MCVDLDIHHVDGAVEAFLLTDRVCTVNFQLKTDTFFPGTGKREDVCFDKSQYYSFNFPMKEGLRDENFVSFFEHVIERLLST